MRTFRKAMIGAIVIAGMWASFGVTAAPVQLSLYTNEDFYLDGETVAVRLSMYSSISDSVTAYLAFQAAGGGLYFFNVENGTLTPGDSSDESTWTPYRNGPIALRAGAVLRGVEVGTFVPSSAGVQRVYAALFDTATGAPVSGIASWHFSAFQYKQRIVNGAIHVGDYYDPYMASWEVPYPEGVDVTRGFNLPRAPTGDIGVEGSYWGTYYDINPVVLDGYMLGHLPGLMNSNSWHRTSALFSSSLLHEGGNRITFISARLANGHHDNYMVKDVDLFYNAAGK